MASETSLRSLENGFARLVSKGVKKGLVRLVFEELENSLREVKYWPARLVS